MLRYRSNKVRGSLEACIGITYHTECPDEFFGRLNTGRDDHLNEVGGDTDDDDHADGLENADHEEHLAQRHSIVAWDRHDG